jgi:hypothetical protein
MAREISIGDRVAITATVGKRIDDRVTLHILTANNPYSIVDPKAKPGDRMRFEGARHGRDQHGRTGEEVPSAERHCAADQRADRLAAA